MELWEKSTLLTPKQEFSQKEKRKLKKYTNDMNGNYMDNIFV